MSPTHSGQIRPLSIILITNSTSFSRMFGSHWGKEFRIIQADTDSQVPLVTENATISLCLAPATLGDIAADRRIHQFKLRHPNSPVILFHDAMQLDALIKLLDTHLFDHYLPLEYDEDKVRSIFQLSAMRVNPERIRIASPTGKSPATVLIVDDETTATKYLKKQLDHMQSEFRVVCAASAEEAMATLQHVPVQVLMTDQRMPGISGKQLLQEVKRRYPSITRILTSAYEDLDIALDAANEDKIFRYQKKPWQPEEILNCLRDALAYTAEKNRQTQLNAQKILFKYQRIIEKRKRAIATMLIELLKCKVDAVDRLIQSIESIRTQPVQSAHLRASEQTSLENNLIILLRASLERELSALPPLAQQQGIEYRQNKLLQWLDLLTPDQKSFSHLSCDKHYISIPMLSHLFAPLTRVAPALIEQQSALILIWSTILELGGSFQLEGGSHCGQLTFRLPQYASE